MNHSSDFNKQILIFSGKIADFLRQYGLHSRNKRIRRKIFKRRRVICGYPGHVVMGDLIAFPKTFKRQNIFNGRMYSYIMVLIDCFSKKMWARPLSKKSKEQSALALISIFDSMESPPTMFVTDKGTGILTRDYNVKI